VAVFGLLRTGLCDTRKETSMSDEKGPGRGRGRFTAAGVQAQQSADIEALKAAVAALAAAGQDLEIRVEVLEGTPEPVWVSRS
jgi:nucleotide-binding universal stress UspA family protein